MAKKDKCPEFGSPEFMKANYNETAVEVSRKSVAHKFLRDSVAKAQGKKAPMRIWHLVKVDDSDKPDGGEHYVATITGGLNGPGLWTDYFAAFQRLVKAIGAKNCWTVGLFCDCADDVHDIMLGFRIPKKGAK